MFLDKLMQAESNGRSHAKNPRSSALGPFQFINSTFLAVMRRHFPEDVANLSERQILALRTDHKVARRAAEAFTRENMEYLAERGITPTFGHLRLAFLLGPQGAARVLQASPSQRLTQILNDGVISANPFMRRMSAADLVARATRDVSPRDVPAPAPSSTIVADAAPAVTTPPALVADSVETETVADAATEPAADSVPAQPLQVADAGPLVPAQPEAGSAGTDAASAPKQQDTAAAPAPASVAETAEADTPAPAAAADTGASKPAAPASGTVMGTIKARHLNGGIAVINVKCDDRQASCRRWIDQQVAALIKG